MFIKFYSDRPTFVTLPISSRASCLAIERERLVTASLVMAISRASAGGSNYPENGLVKPPRRNTRETQPSRNVRRKGAASLCGAEEKTARAISSHA